MIKYLLLPLLLILLLSCKPETSAAPPLDEGQQQKLDMTAVSMMDALATNRPKVIMDNFDHRSFSKRLGNRFHKMNQLDQSLIMGILIKTIEQHVSNLSSNIAENDDVVILVDTRQKGAVSMVVLGVMDNTENYVKNFVVLYLKENTDGEFVLVNFYNVFSGKSFGQIAKDMIAMDFQGDSGMKGLLKANDKVKMAQYLDATGDFQGAYDQMNGINDRMKNFGVFAIYRAGLARKVGNELYVHELKVLSDLSPNEQSKQFYFCESQGVQGHLTDLTDCNLEVIEMLLSE